MSRAVRVQEHWRLVAAGAARPADPALHLEDPPPASDRRFDLALASRPQRDLLAKSPFRRLVVQVPLVLQALALILLALAFARPAIRGGAVLGDYLAIVVDTSASMNARRRTARRALPMRARPPNA